MRFDKILLILLFCVLFSHSPIFCQDTLATADTVAAPAITIADEALPEIQSPTFIKKLITNKYLPYYFTGLILMILLYFPVRQMRQSVERILDRVQDLSPGDRWDYEQKLSTYKATTGTLGLIIPLSVLGFLIHVAVVDTVMEGYVKEWINLIVRWAHVVAGIMWIGASFYFIFLENNLNRTKNIRSELAGNLWAVHGGGFYFLEKYKVAPKQIPDDLHWFKYEAYFTFITGFLLLVIVYYLDAKGFLIDPSVMDMSVSTAIGLSLLSIVAGWAVYDLLCKSKLIQNNFLFLLVGFIVMVLFVYFLTHVFNPRAAYIHFGAVIGAIMVGNVFFNIIPAQKAMVRAASVGEPLNPELGIKASQRSLHNNYFTLPVIFIMISNHYPSTFGHPQNWIILIVIALASALIKHYWNLLERGVKQTKLLVIAVVSLFVLAYVISPIFEEKMDLAIPVSFEEAREVIESRCVSCHSANPTDDEWKKAPNGVMYDTPEQIKFKSDKIITRAVRSKTMPPGNKTKMTEAERVILKRWILQGAKINE